MSLLLFFIALMLMLAAVLSVLRAHRVEQITKVNERLEAIAFLSDGSLRQQTEDELMQALSRWLSRVGFPIKPSTALLLISGAVVSGVIIFKTWGALPALLWWGLVGIVAVFIPQVRYRQKVNQIIAQIPLFIDQVIRGMVTGRNVEGAIKLAAEDMEDPLRSIIVRAQNSVDIGADLGDALREAAEFHDIKELHMLALAIHISRVYGGSPKDMLESIVSLIRQREQAQRELRAMTGETRVSAWVIGLLPTFVALYINWINPDYIKDMWFDPDGQRLIIIAASMQALGGVVLWRMIKSI